MSHKANLDSLSKVVNAVADPVEKKEQLCDAFHREIIKNIKPLFQAYLFADNKTRGGTARWSGIEITDKKTEPSVSIKLYCDSKRHKSDNCLIEYIRNNKGYTIKTRSNSYNCRLEQVSSNVSLDDVIAHFILKVSQKSDDFCKAIGEYKEIQDRKQRPFLERIGLKKPKPSPQGN